MKIQFFNFEAIFLKRVHPYGSKKIWEENISKNIKFQYFTFVPRFRISYELCIYWTSRKVHVIKDHAFLKTEPLSILFNHDDDNIPWAYPEIPKVDPKRKQSGFCLGKIPWEMAWNALMTCFSLKRLTSWWHSSRVVAFAKTSVKRQNSTVFSQNFSKFITVWKTLIF